MSTDEEDKYASMTLTVSGRLLNDLRVGAMLPCDQTIQCGVCGAIWWDVPEDLDENWHAEGCAFFQVELLLGISKDVRKGPAPDPSKPYEVIREPRHDQDRFRLLYEENQRLKGEVAWRTAAMDRSTTGKP